MKTIFEYLDYRLYLKDYYLEKKRTSKFSFREFSKMAGFTSPVFIKLVMEGKSNLRNSSIGKLSQAVGLVKTEKSFFENLVLFDQAKNIDEKMKYLEKLKKSTSTLKSFTLTDEHFEYFSQWYHAVVKELLNSVEFTGDFAGLAAMIHPSIKVSEVEESVELLRRLGLVQWDGHGPLTVTRQFISTAGISMQALAVKNVQRKMARLAADSLDSVPAEERDISGVSIGISEEGFIKAREELGRCRRRLLELAAQDFQSDRVYRVNLHLFPLSAPIAPGSKGFNK
jgi:uncharacterized protein (TIGR02147 family)